MKVILRQKWFGPDGRLYERSEKVSGDAAFAIEIPDEFRKLLPSSAQVIGEAGVVEPAATVQAEPSLKDFDIGRRSMEIENALRAEADADDTKAKAEALRAALRKK